MGRLRPWRIAYSWDDATDIKGVTTHPTLDAAEHALWKQIHASLLTGRPFSWRVEYRTTQSPPQIRTRESGRVNHAADGRALIVTPPRQIGDTP